MSGEDRGTEAPRSEGRTDDGKGVSERHDGGERKPPEAVRRRRRRRKRRPLPFTTRIWFWLAGGLLFALGIAGLFLPFLQGVLFLLLAAALLSLASDTVYGWLERATAERWPHLWRRLERFRTRVHWTLRPRVKKPDGDVSQDDALDDLRDDIPDERGRGEGDD